MNGRASVVNPAGRSVSEILAAYVKWGRRYYAQSNELDHVKYALKPLRELYGRTLVADFGPVALKVVRQRMILEGLSRPGVNKRIERIRRVFRWGVENELVPADVLHALQAVKGLAAGRTEAPETEPVRPAPEAFVEAIEPHVLPPVWAMIQLQRLTAMRPGEVVRMRTMDLDTSGHVWVYRPPQHKTAFRGHVRQIYVGPQAQEILKPWLKADLAAFLFSPAEAMEAQRAERTRQRRTPRSCGNRVGSNRQRKPAKLPGSCYTVESYRHAVKEGCLKADVPSWTPHQLRHNAATGLRKEFGLDVARVILGHRSAAVTEIYAELDVDKAVKIMERVG
jgi:integrase